MKGGHIDERNIILQKCARRWLTLQNESVKSLGNMILYSAKTNLKFDNRTRIRE